MDEDTLREAYRDTRGLFVVAEDHYPEGGIAAAVLETLANQAQRPRISPCAVQGLPGSGTPADMMKAAGISAVDIASAARALVRVADQPR